MIPDFDRNVAWHPAPGPAGCRRPPTDTRLSEVSLNLTTDLCNEIRGSRCSNCVSQSSPPPFPGHPSKNKWFPLGVLRVYCACLLSLWNFFNEPFSKYSSAYFTVSLVLTSKGTVTQWILRVLAVWGWEFRFEAGTCLCLYNIQIHVHVLRDSTTFLTSVRLRKCIFVHFWLSG